MKKRILKGMALILAIILALPILPGNGYIVSAATKPSISMTKKTIIGIDTSFTLNLLNAGKNVKRMTWYSQNEKIATVEATNDPLTGKVTTVGKGTTNIKCKITYKNGKVARPACKITVKITATGVQINNANDTTNNRHVIAVGETYDFNETLTPSNASENTYWSIDNTEFATVSTSGVVTGLRPGIVRLKAVASLTPEGVSASIINDAINIEVVSKTVNVQKVVLSDATKLTVTFDRAIDASTVIGSNSRLLDSVVLAAKIDSKGNSAAALGTLTGTLSSDGKTLVIQSTNAFNGTYGIILSSSIKTTDGIALNSYNENLVLNDTGKPQYVNWTTNATGLIVSLNFNEAMDFTNLLVTDAKMITSGHTADASTINILNTEANYVKSKDGKSLTIDLSYITTNDQNKMFSVNLSGIKDLSGNTPASIPLAVFFQTDTSSKPQAQLVSLLRTGYNTLTATFTRDIQTAGFATLSNGDWLQGIIDTDDAKKVNYTISSTSALLTGAQTVLLEGWDSYNVTSSSSAYTSTSRPVNFTVDKVIPVFTKSVLEMVTEKGIDTHILTLTYNKDVTVVTDTGSLVAKMVNTANGEISSRLLYYTATSKNNQVMLILNNDQINESGVYTITIPAGFVRDAYNNLNAATSIQVKRDASVSSALPAPKSIVQSIENPSIIYVYFDKKLDLSTAQNISNYSIIGTGTTIIGAELTENTVSGATVRLTLQTGSLKATTLYPITITGITGYESTYSAMEKYQTTILLYENKAPILVSTKYSYPYSIILTFDETISGNPSFQVLQSNKNLFSSAVMDGNTVVITLNEIPTTNSNMQLSVTQFNSITDANGNKADIRTTPVSTAIQ